MAAKDFERDVDTLIGKPGPDGWTDKAAFDHAANLVDASADAGRVDGVDRAIDWFTALEGRDLEPTRRALLHYFWANAWGVRQTIRHHDEEAAWAWSQPELREQIFHLRTALGAPGFRDLDPYRRAQIFTNLANQLSTAGRFVEAIEGWSQALEILPDFWMARGNRGSGYKRYAQSLSDGGHQRMFAHDNLVRAVEDHETAEIAEAPGAPAFFESERARIAAMFDIEAFRRANKLDAHSLGESGEEQAYRRWCLREGLFLNPLNDLGVHSIAAFDVLLLPTYSTGLEEPPSLIGFFNQMKQEYVSARWLFYEGLHTDDAPHFSDRDVTLFDTLDYPAYGLAVEKTRVAFRAAYSLFDKIGWFLNAYLKLEAKPHQAAFSELWFDKSRKALRPEFAGLRNLPWRGLFWLSRDLFEEGVKEVMTPDARELHEIRKHLEHKYLKLHEMEPLPRSIGGVDPFLDTLSHSLGRRGFEAKTMRLMKLARAALIYLTLGMYWEEHRRNREQPPGHRMDMQLRFVDDGDKV